jgi:predicted nucleic acid-binding protein
VPAEPVRVVLDANVFVSAAIGRGPSTRLVDQWMSSHASFEVIVCPRLIGEIRDVLDRPRVRKRISAEDAREFVGTISALPSQVPDHLTQRRTGDGSGC